MGEMFSGGIWFVDFEFHAVGRVEGNVLHPICMVAQELNAAEPIRVWQDALHAMQQPPFPIDEAALFVAYYASSEMACFKALGWPTPCNILDLYAEFRNHTNGKFARSQAALPNALSYFGEPCIEAMAKMAMRDLVLRGGPWSAHEQLKILNYCESDVHALKRLFLRMDGGDRG